MRTESSGGYRVRATQIAGIRETGPISKFSVFPIRYATGTGFTINSATKNIEAVWRQPLATFDIQASYTLNAVSLDLGTVVGNPQLRVRIFRADSAGVKSGSYVSEILSVGSLTSDTTYRLALSTLVVCTPGQYCMVIIENTSVNPVTDYFTVNCANAYDPNNGFLVSRCKDNTTVLREDLGGNVGLGFSNSTILGSLATSASFTNGINLFQDNQYGYEMTFPDPIAIFSLVTQMRLKAGSAASAGGVQGVVLQNGVEIARSTNTYAGDSTDSGHDPFQAQRFWFDVPIQILNTNAIQFLIAPVVGSQPNINNCYSLMAGGSSQLAIASTSTYKHFIRKTRPIIRNAQGAVSYVNAAPVLEVQAAFMPSVLRI